MGLSLDPVVREIAQKDEGRLAQLAQELGLAWPCNLYNIETRKAKAKRDERKQWAEKRTQSHGLSDFQNDKIGNKWLLQPLLLKAGSFVDAIKLRTNTFGTKVALARAYRNIDTWCRKCRLKPETLGHIIGECTHTKNARIRRHDDMKRFIRNKLAQDKVVFEEATINDLGQLKKPDLIAVTGDAVEVLDITVRYENKTYLQAAAEEKKVKYKDVAELIRLKTGKLLAKVTSVVIGARGAMPKATTEHLRALGLSKSELLTISLMALRSSIEIANAFLDYE